MVIPIELLRQSENLSGHSIGGREEGQSKIIIRMFRRLKTLRIPDPTAGPEVEQIQDLEALEQICFELGKIPDVSTLRRRLATLPAHTESSEDDDHNNRKSTRES